MVHPIASLVNPHAQLAAMEAKRAEEEYQASRENTSLSHRILSRSSSGLYKEENSLWLFYLVWYIGHLQVWKKKFIS